MADPQEISVNELLTTVVVNGQPTVVSTPKDVPLGTIIPIALQQTGNSGQPPENWELRDAEGTRLDLNKLIGDYNFPEDYRLFLNLKAGVGGCCGQNV